MINLELRYVPGLTTVLHVPSLYTCMTTARELGSSGSARFESDSIRYRLNTIEDAVEYCSVFSSALRQKGVSSRVPESFPFNAITWDSTRPSREMWRLTPPGHMLIPVNMDYPGTSHWLYEWEIWSISDENSVKDRLTPLRSLLILGDQPVECFFCGSYRHPSEACPNMWTSPVPSFTTGKLSEINPRFWLEYMKKAGGKDHIITGALDFLIQDMRKLFTWNSAVRLCRSTAATFSESAASPLKSLEVCELKQLFGAVASGDIAQIGAAINRLHNRTDTTAVLILKGFYHIATGSAEKAQEDWWNAEREAQSPMRKCYAAMLQSRSFMIRRDLSRATAAITRALEVDPCPEVMYWIMVLDALCSRKNRVISDFCNMASSPRLISAALAEPLMLKYQTELEDAFTRIWKKQESLAQEHVKQIETVLQQARGAFGSVVVQETAIRLRDWRGRWPRMGYRTLLSSAEFLDGLKNQVMKEVNHKFREALSKFPAYENRCRTILSRLPRRPSTGKLRNLCQEVIRELHDIGAGSRARDLEKLAGFSEEVNSVIEKYEKVNSGYQNYLEKVWQKRMVIKILIYGTVFSIATWIAIYVYELLNA